MGTIFNCGFDGLVWVLIGDVVCWVASFWLCVTCGTGFIDCSMGLGICLDFVVVVCVV